MVETLSGKGGSAPLLTLGTTGSAKDGKNGRTQFWNVESTYSLGSNIGSADGDSIQRLDVSKYSSVSRAVEALNSGGADCADGICIVYSASHLTYFLVMREDKKEEGARIAMDIFGVQLEQGPAANPVAVLETRASTATSGDFWGYSDQSGRRRSSVGSRTSKRSKTEAGELSDGSLSQDESFHFTAKEDLASAGLLSPTHSEPRDAWRQPTVRNLINFDECDLSQGDKDLARQQSSPLPVLATPRRLSQTVLNSWDRLGRSRNLAATALVGRIDRERRRDAMLVWRATIELERLAQDNFELRSRLHNLAASAATATCSAAPATTAVAATSASRPEMRMSRQRRIKCTVAVAWNSLVAFWSLSLVKNGAPRMLLTSLPFWAVGVRLGLHNCWKESPLDQG